MAVTEPLAWGAKVSEAFRNRIRIIADVLLMPQGGASWLMACIAWESGETFSPSILNGAGSGATGLIQFMPRTAKALGTTCEELAKMTAWEQLKYVHFYFKPYTNRLHSIEDTYMAILWPAAIGKPIDTPLWHRNVRPITYRQNVGLDVNRDGFITKAEAATKPRQMLVKGYAIKNVSL